MKQHLQSQENKIIVYHTKEGALELRGDATNETIWATQAEIASLYKIDRSVVTKHIKNIFKDKEIAEKSNVQKMHIAHSDKPVGILFS